MLLNPLDYKIADLNQLIPEKGRLLIAEPFMDDSYFKRSVVLLTNYSNNEAIGFILNKPLKTTLNDILPNTFDTFNTPIYLGGSVESSSLFYIHTLGTLLENSKHVSGNIFFGGNFEQLKIMIAENRIDPNQIMFFMGYAGWSIDQLNQEVNTDSWLVSNINTSIFNKKTLWYKVLQKKGGKYAMLSNFPENPLLN